MDVMTYVRSVSEELRVFSTFVDLGFLGGVLVDGVSNEGDLKESVGTFFVPKSVG